MNKLSTTGLMKNEKKEGFGIEQNLWVCSPSLREDRPGLQEPKSEFSKQ